MEDVIRLDIGCGSIRRDGWEPWDIKDGRSAERLEGIADGQLEAIRASHVLEHISYRRSQAVLSEWARALKIGGTLLVAVPDFDRIVSGYVNGAPADTEPVLMGAQADDDDYHRAIFNRQKITEMLGIAGFDVVDGFAGDEGECARHPWSLNLKAIKRGIPRIPLTPQLDVMCLMSMPRLAWTENMAAVVDACMRLRINYIRSTGVFWGQCLQRMMEDAVADERYRYILTCDYDTVFTPHDIAMLRFIADAHDLDVLAPMQVGRDRDELLAKVDDGTGRQLKRIEKSRLTDPYWPVLYAHFGLTLIRTDALRKLPKPWFLGVPSAEGRWDDDRTDDDIYFWNKCHAQGLKIGMSPQVVVGHLQVLVSWPDDQLKPTHQYMKDYATNGRPLWQHQRQQPSSSSVRGQDTGSERS